MKLLTIATNFILEKHKPLMSETIAKELERLIGQAENAAGGMLSVDEHTLKRLYATLKGLESRVLGHDMVVHTKDKQVAELKNKIHHRKQIEKQICLKIKRMKRGGGKIKPEKIKNAIEELEAVLEKANETQTRGYPH